MLRFSFGPGGEGYGGCCVVVLDWEVEDMSVVMSLFWGGRMRLRGVLCSSFWAGGRGYGGCYVAVLGREVEDMRVVASQF